MKNDAIRSILEKGILAPSADNLQPWKFLVRHDQVVIFLDSQRTKNFCDAANLAPYLSVGAVIENMRLAASSYGFIATAQYFPEPRNPHCIATINFSKDETTGRLLGDSALENRVTNRSFYHPWRKIDPSVFLKLRSVIPAEKGFGLSWVYRKTPSYRMLSRLIGKADRIRFENQRLHRELFDTMRFSRQEVGGTRDGLDIKTFGGGAATALLFKAIASWSRLRILNRFGLSRLFNLYAQMQIASSQAVGLLTGPSQRSGDYVIGGEVMEQLWHEITRLGLAIQPMEALPIFIMNMQINGGQDLTQNQLKNLQQMKEIFYSLFEINDSNNLILLFRMGLANPVKHRSLRRPVETFLVKDKEALS